MKWIKPKSEYFIVSLVNIAKYMGVTPKTVHSWIYKHGLPVCKLPNGQLAITRGLIDEWILTRYKLQKEIRG